MVNQAISNAEEYFITYCSEARWPVFDKILKDFRRKYTTMMEAMLTSIESKTFDSLLEVYYEALQLKIDLQDNLEYKIYLERKENTEIQLKLSGEFGASHIFEQQVSQKYAAISEKDQKELTELREL